MAVTMVPAPRGSTAIGDALTNISNMILQTEALKMQKRRDRWQRRTERKRLGFEERRLGFEEERLGFEERRVGVAEAGLGIEKQRQVLAEKQFGLAEDYYDLATRRMGLEEKRVGYEGERIGIARKGLGLERRRLRQQNKAIKNEMKRNKAILKQTASLYPDEDFPGGLYPEVARLRQAQQELKQREAYAEDMNRHRQNQTFIDMIRQINESKNRQTQDLLSTITRVDKDIANLKESMPLMGPYTEEQMNTWQGLQNIKGSTTRKYLESMGTPTESAALVERSIINQDFYPRDPGALEMTAANARIQTTAAVLNQNFDNIADILNMMNKTFDLDPDQVKHMHQAAFNMAMHKLGYPVSGEVGEKPEGILNWLFGTKTPLIPTTGGTDLLEESLTRQGLPPLPSYEPNFMLPAPEDQGTNLTEEYLERQIRE